jgi:Peptidase_C39 like family
MLNLRHLSWAAAIAALLLVVGPAEAGGAGTGCPPTDPGCLPASPGSVEVNPHPATSSGDLTTVDSGGVLMPIQSVISLPLARVDVAPLAGASAPSFPRLEVPGRYQDPADVSCGVQALGMALSALPGAPPASPALLGFLQGNGMMYDFGTGVEELAYAAQSFGYKGSAPFYGGDLDSLVSELNGGRPVVVSLGTNGTGAPGHFVTVTSVSADGNWVSYNDPTLGEVTVPASEFMRLWGLQGYSGVTVAAEPPPSAPDPMPWVAFSAAIMALISTSPLGRLRKGIGGKLEAGTSIGGSSKVTYSVPKPAPKPAPKPVAKPKPGAPVGVEKAEALFEANPPPPPTPPIPPGVTKAEEEFEAHAPPEPAIEKSIEKLIDAPVLACTLEGSWIGPAPANEPNPSSTLIDVLDAGCFVAGKLDPFDRNPAFVGTNVGTGAIVHNLDQGLQSVPPSNPIIAFVKLIVSALEGARDGVATAYNFACQQVKGEGIYHELLPLDEHLAEAEGAWQSMTLAQKAATVGITVAIVVGVLAIPK